MLGGTYRLLLVASLSLLLHGVHEEQDKVEQQRATCEVEQIPTRTVSTGSRNRESIRGEELFTPNLLINGVAISMESTRPRRCYHRFQIVLIRVESY